MLALGHVCCYVMGRYEFAVPFIHVPAPTFQCQAHLQNEVPSAFSMWLIVWKVSVCANYFASAGAAITLTEGTDERY